MTFFILDKSSYKDTNFIAVGNLHNEGKINAGNKSYISIAESGVVQNIVEKQVIGNLFCAGGYYFSDVKINRFIIGSDRLFDFARSTSIWFALRMSSL